MKIWLLLPAVVLVAVMAVMSCDTSSTGNDDEYGYELNTYTVSGRILNDVGEPMKEVSVYLVQGMYQYFSMTDDKGNYSFTYVDKGTYVLTPLLDGYEFEPLTRTVTVSSKDVTNLGFVGHIVTDAPR